MKVPGDTSLGGGDRAFPSTRWSMVLEARDRDSPACRLAIEELCRKYWKPIYATIRAARNVPNEEAKDLTQEFLLEVIEGDLLERYSEDRGSFRNYLRGALHLFLLETHRKAGRQMRGGDRKIFALQAEEAGTMEERVPAKALSPDEIFGEQWVNTVIEMALRDLAQELSAAGKEDQFRLFDRYEIHPLPDESLSYVEIGSKFGMTESQVSHVLSACRRMLREQIRYRIRDYVRDERDVDEEIRRFFER